MDSPTHCMSMMFTTSNSGSTVSALRWPNNRGPHRHFNREKLSEPNAALPPSVTKRQTRTAHPSLAPNWGHKSSPKPDWTTSYKALKRGRRRWFRHLCGSWKFRSFSLTGIYTRALFGLVSEFYATFFSVLCFVSVAALKSLSNHFRPNVYQMFVLKFN